MTGALQDIATPALIVDLDVLEANLEAMATMTDQLGVALRPHAKTHKCAEIARRQIERGAVGLSVATLGEAEVFADGGIDDLFIAFPLWADHARAARLGALGTRARRLLVGVDSAQGARALGRALSSTEGAGALIELDCGHHRSGVAPDATPEIARALSSAGLELAGVFTFPGHSYAPGAGAAAARDEAAALERSIEVLQACGFDPTIRSGGSTPSVPHTRPGVNEVRPGVYALNDAQQVALGTCAEADVALSALATVVSVYHDRIVLDAGSKVLGTDRPPWLEGHGLVRDRAGLSVSALSEHHAVVALSPDRTPPGLRVGDRVRVIPNHVCNAVNLVDELLVVRADALIDRWPVDARGQNS